MPYRVNCPTCQAAYIVPEDSAAMPEMSAAIQRRQRETTSPSRAAAGRREPHSCRAEAALREPHGNQTSLPSLQRVAAATPRYPTQAGPCRPAGAAEETGAFDLRLVWRGSVCPGRRGWRRYRGGHLLL